MITLESVKDFLALFPDGPKETLTKLFFKLAVDTKTECWHWLGHRSPQGYGIWRVAEVRTILVHRMVYTFKHGDPGQLVIDHLCGVRDCCNPEHLEAVDSTTNILRGNGYCAKSARKETCDHGHPLSGDNLVASQLARGVRECRICQNQRTRERRQSTPDDWVSLSGHNAAKTTCSRGHPLTPDNLVLAGLRAGERKCKICHAEQTQKQYLKRLAKMGRQPEHLGLTVSQFNAQKTHCKRGHPLSGDNLVPRFAKQGVRQCLTCFRERGRDVAAKRRALLRATREAEGWVPSRGIAGVNALKTHCPQGHPLVEGNLVLNRLKKGHRVCLTCRKARLSLESEQRRQRQRAAKETTTESVSSNETAVRVDREEAQVNG